MRPSAASYALALALTLASFSSQAQLAPTDPDWREVDAPPPPVLRTQGLIPLEMPGSSLRFGVDPASVSLGADSVVRYVVVASSATGAVNAMYEGVRCSSGEVKVYARHNPDSGWVPVRNSDWEALSQRPNSRHSLLIARTGACIGNAPNRSAQTIVRDLRAPVDRRFVN
jgi:hypothetical protein